MKAKRTTLLLGAAALCAACLLHQNVLSDPFATGYGDYQQYSHAWEAGRVALERHGEWPLWNPSECGGITTFGNPDSQVYHPLFLLSLLVGTTLALKLFLVLHTAAGLAGTYVFARREARLGIAPAAFAAVAWSASGFFAWHCGTGHAGFIPFYLLPWGLLAWRAATRDPRAAVWVAVIATLVLLGGGVYAFPFFALAIGLDALPDLFRRRRRTRVVRAGVLVVALVPLVAAIRLLPVVEHLRWFPRLKQTMDELSLGDLVEMLTARRRGTPPPPFGTHKWGWTEYAAYVGWGTVVLGTAGAVIARRARARSLLAALVFGLLALGGRAGSNMPWSLLHRLPIFDSLQAPSRLVVLFLFHFVLLAAGALEAVDRFGRGRATRSVALAFVSIVALTVGIDVGREHVAIERGKWRFPEIDTSEGPDARSPRGFHLESVTGREEMSQNPSPARLPGSNAGTGACYTGMSYVGAKGLWPGRVPQVRIEGTEGEVLDWGRTTNHAWAVVKLDSAGALRFNQTWSPGWDSEGPPIRPDQRQVTMDLQAGRHRVAIAYHPRTLAPALGMTLAGIGLSIVLCRRSRTEVRRAATPRILSPAVLAATGVVLAYLVVLGAVT